MKHNKTNAKLLEDLSPTKRQEVIAALEKELPKNANKAVKQAALNAHNKERALERQKVVLSEGATDLSAIWTSPKPTVSEREGGGR